MKESGYRSWLLSPLHKAYRQATGHLEDELGLISGTDGHVLSYVCRYGPCRVGKLAEVFGLVPSTVTSLLNRLEKDKLVRRKLNAEDRRSLLVESTAAGRRLIDSGGPVLEAFETAVGRRASRAAMRGFKEILDAVEAVFEEKRRTKDASR